MAETSETSKQAKLEEDNQLDDNAADEILDVANQCFSISFGELLENIKGNTSQDNILIQYSKHIQQTLRTARPDLFSEYGEAKREVRVSTRQTRPPISATKEKFFLKKRTRNEMTRDVLTSTDSPLCTIPLMDVINAKTFNTMIPARNKDELITLLPSCDTASHENVTELFNNPEFLHSLMLFQRHLNLGTFDTSDRFGRSKKKRQMDPWKLNHFEHVWGQQLLSEILVTPESRQNAPFSYCDAALQELAVFSGPISDLSTSSIEEVRQSFLSRDTTDVFSMIYPEGKKNHFLRRRLSMHRNPHAELVVRSSNTTLRYPQLPRYGTAMWEPLSIPKWEKELDMIRKLQDLPPLAGCREKVVKETKFENPIPFRVPSCSHSSPSLMVSSSSSPIKEVEAFSPDIQSTVEAVAVLHEDSGSEEEGEDSPIIVKLSSFSGPDYESSESSENNEDIELRRASILPCNEELDTNSSEEENEELSSLHPPARESMDSPDWDLVESIDTSEECGMPELPSPVLPQPIFAEPASSLLHEPNSTFVQTSFPTVDPVQIPPSSIHGRNSASNVHGGVPHVIHIPQHQNQVPMRSENVQGHSSGYRGERPSNTYYPSYNPPPTSNGVPGYHTNVGMPQGYPPRARVNVPNTHMNIPTLQTTNNGYPSGAYSHHTPQQSVAPPYSTNLLQSSCGTNSDSFHGQMYPQDHSTSFHTVPFHATPPPSQVQNYPGTPRRHTFNNTTPSSFAPPPTTEVYISDDEFIPLQVKKVMKKKSPKKPSFRSVAYDILKKEGRPLPAKEIVAIALKEDLYQTSGKTPENTLASILYKDLQKVNPPSDFVKINLKPVAFGLREWQFQVV